MSGRVAKPLALIVLCAAGLLLFTGGKAFAYTAAQVDTLLPDAENQIISAENGCNSRLAAEERAYPPVNASVARTDVNNSNPYPLFAWISPRSQPTSTSITVPYGTTSVPLQFNQLQFICAGVVNGNYNTPYPSPTTFVNSAQYPNDRAPNPDGTANTINAASLYQIDTHINGVSVTAINGTAAGPAQGTATSPPNVSVVRSSSRYWPARAGAFTYTSTSAITQREVITVGVNFSYIGSFHNYPNSGGTEACPAPGGGSTGTTAGNFTPCAHTVEYFNFEIDPEPQPPVVTGYKIDNSGTGAHDDVTQTGTVLSYTTPDHSYPFSDDWIQAYEPAFVHSVVTNRFGWSGDEHLNAGSVQFTSQEYTPGTGWYPDGPLADQTYYNYLGFTLCDNATVGGCPSTGPNNINHASGIYYHAAGSAATLANDHSYTIRFIYDKSPPITFTCGSATTSPVLVQAGASYTPTFGVNYSNKPQFTNFEVSSASGLGLNYNATVAPPTPGLNVGGSAVSYTPATPPTAPTTDGSYPVSWQLYNGATPVGPACTGAIQVVSLPYFKAYGASVRAGGDFSPACNSETGSTTTGVIGGWYDSQTAHAGASSFFAAIAEGQIKGFASGQGANAGPPLGLSFSNTTNTTGSDDPQSPNLGGDFDDSHCIYTPALPTTVPSTATTLDLGGVTGTSFYNSNLLIDPSGASVTITNGNQVIVNVAGSVYINSNIVYNPSWASISQIPSFTLIATGNIYIDPNVTQLDGNYVAEGSTASNTGQIYTCGTNTAGTFNGMAAASLINCNKQLVVNGAFTAAQVNLMRTYGTLKNATSTENQNTTTHVCSNPLGGTTTSATCAGEVFNFSPELYLASPNIPSTGSSATTYESINSLPPVL